MKFLDFQLDDAIAGMSGGGQYILLGSGYFYTRYRYHPQITFSTQSHTYTSIDQLIFLRFTSEQTQSYSISGSTFEMYNGRSWGSCTLGIGSDGKVTTTEYTNTSSGIDPYYEITFDILVILN